MTITQINFSKLLKELTDISTALSAEKDHTRLLEMILVKAKELSKPTAVVCISERMITVSSLK